MKWTINTILALLVIASAIILFSLIVLLGIGGEKALFLILGYLAAWTQMIVIHYFRKRPGPEEENKSAE